MKKKKEEEMPAEAKLLLEMIKKARENGVTREEMRNTSGFDWLLAHQKIMRHVRIEGNNLINAWVPWKEKEGAEELPEYLKQVHSTSSKQ